MSIRAPEKSLDVITIGRASADLYGEQVGGRLEDMGSFAKYVGGCPANIAVGSARLGLRSALMTRVGDDPMGRFIREQLASEGVDVGAVIPDPDRLTALAILGIRDKEQFPLLFYREDCADMALCEDDVREEFIARSRAVLITGTHLSSAGVRAASMKAVRLARAHGAKVVLDVDYRPVLWGLTSPEAGEQRFVEDARVTSELQAIIADCDLIVGTEEELHILGGTTDTLDAIRRVRAGSSATIVCKRGALGCSAFDGAIPDSLDEGVMGQSFLIDVFNVLGAGDAFMSGFLRGWLENRPLAECCTWANACGALVVSRHGCAPAIPSWIELRYFLDNGSNERALRNDRKLEHIHWATNRKQDYDSLKILAIDHRFQFEDMVHELGVSPERISVLKEMAIRSLHRVAAGDPTFGILLDGRFGESALAQTADFDYWTGRPIEVSGSPQLEFEGSADVAMEISKWPLTQVVKCLVNFRCSDPVDFRARQERQLLRLFDACRQTRHEFLLEVICSQNGTRDATATPEAMERFYELGVYPDWWKLEPSESAEEFAAISAIIDHHDPWCRGIVLLGLSAPIEDLLGSFAVASQFPRIRGFAVGRSIWSQAARSWLNGEINDEECVTQMSERFAILAGAWQQARVDVPRDARSAI